MLVIGQFGIFEVVIAIILVIITNFLLIHYGLRIYKVGILNYSSEDYGKDVKSIERKIISLFFCHSVVSMKLHFIFFYDRIGMLFEGRKNMIRNLEIHRGILYGEENQKPVSYVLTNQTQDMLHAQAELEMASQLFTDYEKRYEQEKKELKLQSFKAKLSIISVVLTTVVCLLIARVLPYHYLFF